MDTRAHVDVAAPTDTSQPRPSPALEPSQLCQTTKITHSHPKASGSDAAALAHRPPVAEHPDTALVLDIVAAHLAPDEDGVRTANKLACTCTAWRDVGATARTAFASAHDALLDQQLSSLCHASFSYWLVDVYAFADEMHEPNLGFDCTDIRHRCLLWQPVMAQHAFDNPDIDPETVKKYLHFFHSILAGLNAPHLDIALYRRCLHLIATTYEHVHVPEGWDAHYCLPSFFYHGGFLGVFQIVKCFLCGLFDDELLLIDVRNILSRIFGQTHKMEIFYMAHQSWRGGNICLLLADFSTQLLQPKWHMNFATWPLLDVMRSFLGHYDYTWQKQGEENVLKLIPTSMIDILGAWLETATTYLESDPEIYPLSESEEGDLNQYMDKVEDILQKTRRC